MKYYDVVIVGINGEKIADRKIMANNKEAAEAAVLDNLSYDICFNNVLADKVEAAKPIKAVVIES